MSQNTENVQSIIQLLKELDKTNHYLVFLPSLQKEVPFKQLNAEQFKRLLKTVIDSPIYNTEFIVTFNNIIKENILDATVNVNRLNALDKLLIQIKTRINCISPEYTFNFTEEEIKEKNLTVTSQSVNLQELYNSFVSSQSKFDPQEFNVQQCTILCDLPTLETENKLEKELHKNTKLDISSPEELRTTIGDTFINELSKYIQTLKIDDKEIVLENFDFKTRVKIVEQLPTGVINKVLKYIESYKKLIEPLTTFNLKVQDETVTKELPIDATLFNV